MYLDIVISSWDSAVATVVSLVTIIFVILAFARIRRKDNDERVINGRNIKNQVESTKKDLAVFEDITGQKFLAIDNRFVEQEHNYTNQFDKAEKSRSKIYDKFDGMDKKINHLDKKMEVQNNEIGNIKETLGRIEDKI